MLGTKTRQLHFQFGNELTCTLAKPLTTQLLVEIELFKLLENSSI